MTFQLVHGRRAQLRLPLSPVRAEMALRALQNWREPADDSRERSWYRITNSADGGVTRVDVYDEISWWGISAQDFCDAIAGVTGDLEVHINSPGGDAFDGICIFNALYQRAGKVTTVADGLAASAASVIFMAGAERVVSPGAMVMIHDALAMTIGNAADHRETAALLDKVSGNIADIYTARAGKTSAEWREAMAGDAWYTAAEAISAGLAHRLAEPPASSGNGTQAAWDRSVFAAWHGGGVQAKALPVHHTATVDEAWDGPAAVAAMPNDATVLRYCHAWQDSSSDDGTVDDPDGDADDKKSSYKFPHHKTKGGAANLAACRNGLARLSSADIPDGDRAGVEAHLRAHLKDGGADDDSADDHAGGLPAWIAAMP